jgi:DNA-binding response OmpR family regulator
MNRVLVIEDDAAVRGNILDLLEAEGFEGLAADSGESGVELALLQLPDLIICDVSMSGIDGYDVFELLSTRPSTAVIPFIFLSARAERADVRRGMALGADDYLTKPFTRRELLDSIHTRLRRRRASLPLTHTQPQAAGAPAVQRDGLVMTDPCMLALDTELTRAARGTISVLILGETGVGKEVVAEQLHLRSARTCWRASCSATRKARSPAPTRRARDCSKLPMAARCSWTRLASYRRRRRSSCCACSRSARCCAWAGEARGRSTCASWPRPIATSSRPWSRAIFGRICTTD